MLLYDRVVEFGMKTWKREGDADFGKANVHRMKCLAQCQVYELTDVAKLFTDWKTERAKRVPRTPPHENLWAEWRVDNYDDRNGLRMDVSLGCVVSRCLDSEIVFAEGGGHDLLVKAERVYSTQMFRFVHRVHECYAGDPETRAKLLPVIESSMARPQADCDMHFWALNNDGADLEAFHCTNVNKEVFQRLADGPPGVRGVVPISATVLGLPMLTMRIGAHSTDQLWSPWPVWMAFALLHCKNVVAETHAPDAKVQRQVAKHGNPPRATWKTLKVCVPAAFKRSVAGATEGGDGPRVRFHVCSGHFKNLQHERFKEKGWHWWNAHWRGSKELGEVHTRRQLRPSR